MKTILNYFKFPKKRRKNFVHFTMKYKNTSRVLPQRDQVDKTRFATKKRKGILNYFKSPQKEEKECCTFHDKMQKHIKTMLTTQDMPQKNETTF